MKKFSTSALMALFGTTALVSAGSAFAQDADPAVTEEPSTEIVVRGALIPNEKRATSEVSSLLDEDDLARTGDSDIGGALQRVTGLSLSEGRFVVVRGLNERYSSITLDGSPLPSPEPLRRVIPLDIVPTSILSGTLVQKTFSPQFSAEFGGGLVELRTKSLPDDPYFEVGFSVSGDTETWGQDGLTYIGSNSDDLGTDNGLRSVPAIVRQAYFGANNNAAEFDPNAIDAAFNASRTAVIYEGELSPSFGVNAAFGNSFEAMPGLLLGGNFAIGYSNDWTTRQGRREQGFTNSADGAKSDPFNITGSIPNAARISNFTGTEQTVEFNALGSVGAELGQDHRLTWTNLLLRSTAKEARQANGLRGEDASLETFVENFEFIERQVWQTQLRGDHVVPGVEGMELIWRVAYGEADRDSPYQRSILRARRTPASPFLIPGGGNDASTFANGANTLSFSLVEDTNFDAGVDVIYPFAGFGQTVELKFGANYTTKERDALVRDFVYGEGSLPLPQELWDARNDVLLSPSVVGTDVYDISFNPGQDSLDNAHSLLQVAALYAGADFEIGPYVRVAAGGRFEAGKQKTNAFRTGRTDLPTSVLLDEDYFLPAATLTWNPVGDLQLRFGFSQTITRPQFRELTPAVFTDDQTDQRITGNPFLVNSEIDNFDARAEYYFSREQFVTLGFFYKDIQNPIETTSAFIGEEVTQTYVNAPSASLYGVEAEFERLFALGDMLGDTFASTDLLFKANYTWSQSEVSADGDVIVSLIQGQPQAGSIGLATPTVVPGSGYLVDGRELQGQSEHLLNFQVGIEDEERAFRTTLLLNWASERIRHTENLRSNVTIPAVIEQPPLTLDLVASKGFQTPYLGGWEAGFSARNLLGEDYEATQSFPTDGTTANFDVYDVGTSVSVSLKKIF